MRDLPQRALASYVWLVVIGTFALALGVAASLRVASEHTLIVRSTLHDRRFFGEIIERLVDAPSPDPDAAMHRILSGESVRGARIDASVDEEGAAREIAREMPAAQWERFDRREVITGVRGERITTLVPIGGSERWLELDEPVAGYEHLAWHDLRWATAASFAIAVLAGAFAWLFLRRAVGQPLAELAELADLMAEGDLEARSHLEARQDEIGRLARSVHRLADQLEDQRARIAQSGEPSRSASSSPSSRPAGEPSAGGLPGKSL